MTPVLRGPKVPADFKDNGCGVFGTHVGDGCWAVACRIHDYEYSLIKQYVPVMRQAHIEYLLSDTAPGMAEQYRGELSAMTDDELIAELRARADANLEANISLLSRKRWYWRVPGLVASKTYFALVRTFGRMFCR